MATYEVQSWRGQELVHTRDDLTLPEAERLAVELAAEGFTARMIEIGTGADWTRVYTPEGEVRTGTIAETTRVTVEADHATDWRAEA